MRSELYSVAIVFAVAVLPRANPAQPPVQQQAAAASPGYLSIPTGQKFIMQLETPLHTRTTRQGDSVEFRTAADIVIDNQLLIPNQSLIVGNVTKVRRAGRLFGRAEIQLRFDQIKLTDGTALPLRATITRVGFDPISQKDGADPKFKGEAGGAGDAKAVLKGGAQGAISGVLYGGGRGAMYGAAAGAAITLAGQLLRRGPDVDLPRSTMFEAQFDNPVTIPAATVLALNAAQPKPTGQIEVPVASDAGAIADKPPVLKDARLEKHQADGSGGALPVDNPSTATVPGRQPVGTTEAAEVPDPAPGGVRLSVKVRMVQVDVAVRDRAGHMIDYLKVDDFRVYEDAVLQEVLSFSQDELPLAVALVVDRSGSVAPYLAQLRTIAARALAQLKPDDQVCLYSFAGSVDRLEDLTTDRERIAAAIDRIQAGGGTDIIDALYDSIKYMARTAPDRRHAVILISDNQQTVPSQASDGETIQSAMESDTAVYSIKTAGERMQLALQLPSLLFGGGSVSKIARETGGEVINAGSVASLDGALGAVISRLRKRYSLGYYPSNAAPGGSFHSIAVRLPDRLGKPGRDYFVHAKRGYYATGR